MIPEKPGQIDLIRPDSLAIPSPVGQTESLVARYIRQVRRTARVLSSGAGRAGGVGLAGDCRLRLGVQDGTIGW